MTERVVAGVAAGWLTGYLLTYVWVVTSQDGEVARWYLVLGVLGLVACVVAAAGLARRAMTATALVLTAVTALTGLLTIGALLVPAVLALAFSFCAGLARPGRTLQQHVDERPTEHRQGR